MGALSSSHIRGRSLSLTGAREGEATAPPGGHDEGSGRPTAGTGTSRHKAEPKASFRCASSLERVTPHRPDGSAGPLERQHVEASVLWMSGSLDGMT